MRTIMKTLFVTAMALTLVYTAGAGITYAADRDANNGGPAYTDFINGAPTYDAGRTPAVMGAWE